MKRISVKWIGWIFLGVVTVAFFPRWYVLSYTKLWELKQLVKQDREGQMQIMHPADQMGQLLALKSYLALNFSHGEVLVVLPDVRTLPLSQNPAIVRGVLSDSLYDLHVSTITGGDDQRDIPCVYIGEATAEAQLIPQQCIFWSGK